MIGKVLFLSRNIRGNFYYDEQNKYKNVTSKFFFKKTGKVGTMLRKMLKLPGTRLFFDEWKNHIDEYDLFIIRASKFSLEVAKYIRKRSDKKIAIWYWNPVCADIQPDKIRGYGTEFYSFDPEDCKRYGMKYIPTYYFSTLQLPKKEIMNDIFFIGADKGRLERLLEIKEKCEEQGLTINLYVTKSKESKNKGTYTFRQSLSYHQVLEEISKTRAILDYVQDGQSGLTLRPMEALFFKKKLITNNMFIRNCDFYNKNNIFILGHDDINNLNDFINSTVVDIDRNIIERYDFIYWLERIEMN